MKQIRPIQVQAKEQPPRPGDIKINKKQQQDLSRIQSDKSFLPEAKDLPVHKCGCT